MGVEYSHFLIPRPNSFRPNAEQLARFVQSLGEHNWIARPGSDAMRKWESLDGVALDDYWARICLPDEDSLAPHVLTASWFQQATVGDLKLGFPVEHGLDVGLQYPLLSDLGPPEDPYYEIQLHVATDFIHHSSELIQAIEPVCSCGQQLEYDEPEDVFFAPRIRRGCPRCSKEFDPSTLQVRVRDGWTNKRSVVSGGAIYRFAIVIDCGKCIPERKDNPIRANPTFVHFCQDSFGHCFYEVGDIH
jgi:hypothetical protein